MKRKIYGVGLNDADYVVRVKETVGYARGKQQQKQVWACPFYVVWTDMLRRCYSEKFLRKNPTYLGCSVAPEWHLFSNFKSWMEQQDWEGKQLDKDLLVLGNKVYSPDTCLFVPPAVNTFFNTRECARGALPVGVFEIPDSSRFYARCSDPFTRTRGYIGSFETPAAAHDAWIKRKRELAAQLATMQTDERVSSAILRRADNLFFD